MKQKTGKPRYIRHLIRALIPCMAAALLIGIVGTAGLYGIRYKTVTTADAILFSDTERALSDAGLSQMTPVEISELLAHNARTAENDPVDRAFLLEHTSTGERYDSAAGLYADCQIKSGQFMTEEAGSPERANLCFVCADDAFQAISERLEALRYENRRSKDRFRVNVKEIYVREGSSTFQPGIVELIRITFKTGRTETVDTLDLTPADRSGLTRLTVNSDHLSVSWMGSPSYSQGLASVRALGENAFNSRNPLFKRGEPLEVMVGFLSPEGKRSDKPVLGDSWILREVTYYHFWQDSIGILTECYAILLCMTVLTAAVIAVFTTMHSRRVWEMEQYRRSLTNTLAHDLRTPLTAITGYTENLQSGVHPEKQAHYMDAIQKNAAYMDRIISDVLELSVLERTQKAHTEPVDLMQLFREAFAQYEPQLQDRSITLHTEGQCSVRGDRRMITQAAANLVSNAVRYTPDGGEIRVSGSKAHLQITNTCHDIDDAASLAEPFARGDLARSDRSGSGLGLTIVRQIMELHGFRLRIRSQEHTFDVMFVMK